MILYTIILPDCDNIEIVKYLTFGQSNFLKLSGFLSLNYFSQHAKTQDRSLDAFFGYEF